jgi:hypothetical protein
MIIWLKRLLGIKPKTRPQPTFYGRPLYETFQVPSQTSQQVFVSPGRPQPNPVRVMAAGSGSYYDQDDAVVLGQAIIETTEDIFMSGGGLSVDDSSDATPAPVCDAPAYDTPDSSCSDTSSSFDTSNDN